MSVWTSFVFVFFLACFCLAMWNIWKK